ncbi:MAG: site-2 protease family protein [Chloroflexi bacterium]|nr:site-2 protease family protein [Chloroflexota bacterium]
MDLATKLLVFFLALGGMIFLHELGHYLASRWAKIDVEEFGFGLPPRALALWRAKGYLLFNRQRVEIPKNFERNFDWFGVERRPAVATVDQDGDKYILRTMSITFEEKVVPPQPKANQAELTVGANGQVVSDAPEPVVKTQTLSLGTERGSIEWTGQIDEVHPGTLLSLNWLPLGGFVRPKGETDPSVPGGLGAASPWKRIMVYVAGPVMNLLTAIIVYSLITGLQGVPVKGPVRLEEISPASPALEAGLQPNDVILSINGQTVSQSSDVSNIIYNNLDKPLTLVVDRGGQQVTITATPLSSRVEGGQGPLGILMAAPATRSATLGEIVSNGVVITGIQAASIVYLPIALIQGAISPDQAQLVGLVGIFDIVSSAVDNDVASRQEPVQTSAPAPRPSYETLLIIASLSVSLGIINLFPIPALDGGRILFTLPELIFRRRIPADKENIVNGVAMLLLIALMLFINGRELLAKLIP